MSTQQNLDINQYTSDKYGRFAFELLQELYPHKVAEFEFEDKLETYLKKAIQIGVEEFRSHTKDFISKNPLPLSQKQIKEQNTLFGMADEYAREEIKKLLQQEVDE